MSFRGDMANRIIGVIVFLWCGVGVVGTASELLDHEGARFGTSLGALIFCLCCSLIGLAMALRKPKPPVPPSDEQPPKSE